jgi:hypothetical protein
VAAAWRGEEGREARREESESEIKTKGARNEVRRRLSDWHSTLLLSLHSHSSAAEERERKRERERESDKASRGMRRCILGRKGRMTFPSL